MGFIEDLKKQQEAMYSPGVAPMGNEAGFHQEHPGARNIPMYQEPAVRQNIAQNYQPGMQQGGMPLTQDYNPMQALFGKLGLGEIGFLEQLLQIRGQGDKKKKKKK